MALVLVVLAMILLMAGILAAYMASVRARTSIDLELQYNGQALNIARAGVADALSWFRRQTTQPVTVFNPQRDLAAIPPVNDTDDPAIGLVRSLEVSSLNQIWARYEVRLTRVADITALRGLTGTGLVWLIDSEGLVYQQLNPALPYNQYPNRVLARIRLQTEIRRMGIVLPAPAAICTAAPTLANFSARSKVMGGTGIGCVYPSGAGVPTVAGLLQGSPAQSAVNPYKGSIQEVFGVTDAELRSIADIYTTDQTTITAPLPSYRIIYVDSNITFNSQRPLSGTAILIVTGNLVVAANSNTDFNGIIYVRGPGNCQLNAPSFVRGSVVGSSNINLIGSGDYVEVDYDPGVISDLLQRLGQYRYSRPLTVIP